MSLGIFQEPVWAPAFDQLGEAYLIKQEIGRSQAASLYQAVERVSGRPVALKVFRRKFSADPRFALNFRDLMRRVFALEHEYLASIWDYGMVEGVYYIASERVIGQNLGAYLAKAGSVSELQAIAISSQVCQALEEVHRHDLLHQNLKPENILLTQQGKIKLTDVGLSGLMSESGITRTHVMQGRYHYIAPEQVNGQEPTPASDLYSLGVILYEMLTGSYPFDSRDVWDVLRMHVEVAPAPLDRNLPAVSNTLVNVVQQSLQKPPELRFQSAGAMNTALTSVLLDNAAAPYDPGAAYSGDIWSSLQRSLTRMFNFLHRPAPFRVLGRLVSFGWVLLAQFAVTFLLAFLFLNAVISLNNQVQGNRSVSQQTVSAPDPISMTKSLIKTGLTKNGPVP